MKIVKNLYYIFVTLFSAVMIFLGIAEPAFFISVIPAAFLLALPKLYEKHVQNLIKKVSDIDVTQPGAKEALSTWKAELEEKENKLNAREDVLTEKELKIKNEELKVKKENKMIASIEWELKRLIDDMSGETFEKYVGFRLARKGWTDVEYTSTTGDYGADIIATDVEGIKTCIQCKRYGEHVGIQAVQEAFSAKQYYGCQKAMVITNSTYTAAATDLANKTGVDLWANFR